MSSNTTLGERMREAREGAEMTIQEAADRIGIKYSRLVSWENNHHRPNADYIIKMCKIYNVSADELLQTSHEYTLNIPEAKIIKVFRELSEQSQELFMMIVRDFSEFAPQREESSTEQLLERPLYDLPASAGSGQFLDSDTFEMKSFPSYLVPSNATFCVRVSGDSMEPDYPDGSIVFVSQTKDIQTGDIGIFILNNEGYIKQAGDNRNLISINPDYDDIHIDRYDDLRVVGKIVGEPYLEK